MTAPVIDFPVVMRPNYDRLDWCEQFDRECNALECEAVPPRTRPLPVINNDRADRAYRSVLLRLRDVLKDA